MKELYEGVCVGGPLDGEVRQSRYPKGALLVDKPSGSAWVYDFHPGPEDTVDSSARPQFVARDQAPLSDEGRMRAATEFTYDVWAL